MATAKFIYDTVERCPDLYYASRFTSPDAFIFFETRKKKYLVLKDLELDRAKKSANVNKILSLSDCSKKAEKTFKKPSQIDILDIILKKFKIKKLEVPPDSPYDIIKQLEKRHYKITAGDRPFYAERMIKTKEEVKFITNAQKTVFKIMGMVEEILRTSKIKKNLLYHEGKALTCEKVRKIIHVELLKRGYQVPKDTIVTCGKNSFYIHSKDMGYLRPNEAIIVDIFPRSMDTLYCGDATRTFCVGKAPDTLKRMYATVKEGYKYALDKIRDGVNGKEIHEGVHKIFEANGYKTGNINGFMQGFFHSTGHGIGLEIHDVPVRIGPVDEILKAGMVVSVEPGLYYKDIGGVRIEDLVYITKNGCKILGQYPKRLEIL